MITRIRKPRKPNPVEDGYKPLSLYQWIMFQLHGHSYQWTNSCWQCGEETQGNRITGYYLPCGHPPYVASFLDQLNPMNWRDSIEDL